MKEQDETVEVTIHNNPNGLYSEITVQYGSSGDIYAIELSRSAHEQLKEYFLNEHVKDVLRENKLKEEDVFFKVDPKEVFNRKSTPMTESDVKWPDTEKPFNTQ